jgi:TolB-like protein/class 3 adenylate cyclase/tetratricopeptide (TPR) repeat protein
MTESVKRRLAVILAFDMVGYSRLMEEDEEGTHQRTKDVARDVIEPLLAQHEGRLVKKTGDGGLVEFASVVEAARWALGMQRRMAERNAPEAPSRRIEFRIGISLGDIIIEPDDIYGEGVNIAARLQELADAGGICVTHTVVDQVHGRVDGRFVDLGEPKLKNISRPLRIFRLVDAESGVPGGTYAPAVLSPIVSGFGSRPVIAVMPLDTFSNSQNEEYFADGLTEDITTALSNWRSFPVISRNSAFSFKGRKIELKAAGRELGARYLVEGSVRRQASQVRMNIQLVEAEVGHQLYAEHYDRDISDVLGVQDEIATSIVGVLEPELLRVERDRASTAPASVAAYDLLQRGLWHHYRRTKEDSVSAQAFFHKALAADPNYAQAAAALSVCLSQSMLSGWMADPQGAIVEAFELAQRAVFLDARDPLPHYALGLACLHSRRIPLGVREMEEAVRLNPSYAAAHANLGNFYNYLGRPDEALELVTRALRLSPNDPRLFLWIPPLAGAHYLAGRYEQAIEAGRYGLAIKPDYLHCLRYVVAALGQLGRQDEAAGAIAQLRTLDGKLANTASFLAAYYIDHKSLEHILEGLRKAGFG